MPAALSAKGQVLLDDLPVYFHEDPLVQAVCEAVGSALQELEDAAVAIREGLLPSGATDANSLLAAWEQLLGLPVQPAGQTEATRRSNVLALYRARRAASGEGWMALVTRALGTTQWSHEETSPYTLVVRIPYSSSSYTAAQVERLLRAITPANLQFTATYDEGFLVGISRIGEPI